MKLAIMQPYFFPYIGYFQLINTADRFILFDDVQYIRHGWVNRNRILKPAEGHQYIIMPLAEQSRDALIKDTHAIAGYDWKEKILRQLEHYKKKAPFYREVLQLLTTCFEYPGTSLSQLNGNYLQRVCNYLGMEFKIEVSSLMSFDYSNVGGAGEWALRISEQLNASEYINPPGGVDIFDNEKFKKSGIKLSFIYPELKEYSQRRTSFDPGLSIIDVLMFNSPDEARNLIGQYKVKRAGE